MSSLPSSQNVPSETPETTPGADEIATPASTAHEQSTQPENGEALDDEAMEEVDESVMSLPLSKIKRIFKMDPEYFGLSASAVYATGVATELFVQYLTEHASLLAKMERRKKIQYKDFSNAVSSQDALYFLNDTIPKTQTVGQAIKDKLININDADKVKHTDAPVEVVEEAQAAPAATKTAPQLPKGQSSLPFEPLPKATFKKAVLHDLMSNDDEGSSDAMVID